MFKPAMVRAEIRLSMSEIFRQQEDTKGRMCGYVVKVL